VTFFCYTENSVFTIVSLPLITGIQVFGWKSRVLILKIGLMRLHLTILIVGGYISTVDLKNQTTAQLINDLRTP